MRPAHGTGNVVQGQQLVMTPQDLGFQFSFCSNVPPQLDYCFGIALGIQERIHNNLEIRIGSKDVDRTDKGG